jgi:predicted ATPase
MKLEQLTIENFKCFKSEKTFDFPRLTILTGANSSGKSSVINAILMVLQSEGFPNSLSTNGDYVNLGDFKDISNSHNNNSIVKIGLKVEDFESNNLSVIQTEWKEDKIDLLPKLFKFEASMYNPNFKPNPCKLDEQRVEYYFTNSRLNHHSINYISAFRQAPRRTYLEKNKADFKVGSEGEGYIDQIVEWDKRSNGKIKQLIKTMKALDLIDDIKIKRLGGGRFEVLVKPVNSNDFSALNDVGSGVSAFMPIMVADLQLHDSSMLFLAEPEIHLHPSVQAKFIDYIVNQINNSEKNYVIETHSEYFLNRIRLAIVKGELKKEDVKIYFLENTKEDTDVFDIDFTETGAIKNAPRNFFETYSMDVMNIALNAFAE